MGLCAEAGEYMEIVKKMVFQGKPLTEDNIRHMMLELSDCQWYWINGCRALGVDPNEVIKENVNKLINRYPAGKFDVHYSENRKENDL
jgi:NTP pyrophosphatase (non-canonical NTP hydrolase)